VLSSDEVVHQLYLRPEVRDQVVARLGPSVLSDGEVDRAKLGAIAFADPEVLRFLEGILHPLVGEEAERFRRGAEAAGARVAVQEVPLLFERGGTADRYDRTVLITASDDVRRARAGERFDRRAPHQLAEPEKAALADEVFVNDGDVAELERWVQHLVDRLAA
jgi:dephospho-CoA kinase